MANVKVGNFVRQADTTPLATIIQMAPVYVTFSVPQRHAARPAPSAGSETATVEAVIPGEQKRASGQVTMIENTVDRRPAWCRARHHAEHGRAAVAGHAGDGAS